VRDAHLFVAFFAIIPFIFKRPVVGALVLRRGQPDESAPPDLRPAYDFPFAMVLCVVTLLQACWSRRKRRFR
jgi:putative inorganic carbon (HCO3(-)) transporter